MKSGSLVRTPMISWMLLITFKRDYGMEIPWKEWVSTI